LKVAMPPRFFYPDTPDLPLPPRHRFPAGKYSRLRQRVEKDRLLGSAALAAAPPASLADLHRAHTTDYVNAVLQGTLSPEIQRRIGLPWSATLARRSRATVGGSLAAAREALAHGISGQLAGGTHHAHRGFGSGYCTFNDLAVAALALLADGTIDRVAILDCDVHQGDGNAAILAAEANAFVVSIHGEKNFPFRKVPSDLDIALPDGTDDRVFLSALEDALAEIGAFRPDLLLYLSGADPLVDDSLGRLALTLDGLGRRDQRVFSYGLERGFPIAVVAGGGYAKPIELTVEAYAQTYATAARIHGL
jgi:acetoin utilization deacetylase AcuC-like enzyme